LGRKREWGLGRKTEWEAMGLEKEEAWTLRAGLLPSAALTEISREIVNGRPTPG
jgi:hypothetical protein